MSEAAGHPTAAPEPYEQHTPCPKCGSLAVTTEMCTRTVDPQALLARMVWPATCWWDAWLLPHIHRDCQNCGHVFYQRPLDAAPADCTPERLAARRADYERREEERRRELEKWNDTVAKATAGAPERADPPPTATGRTRWFRRSK